MTIYIWKIQLCMDIFLSMWPERNAAHRFWIPGDRTEGHINNDTHIYLGVKYMLNLGVMNKSSSRQSWFGWISNVNLYLLFYGKCFGCICASSQNGFYDLTFNPNIAIRNNYVCVWCNWALIRFVNNTQG